MTDFDEFDSGSNSENSEPKRRGRKRKHSSAVTQHPVWMEQDLWDAAGDLPESRPDIIRQALADRVAFYKTSLPKLRIQLAELEANQYSIEAKIAVVKKQIQALEDKAAIEVSEQKIEAEQKELAVQETIRMCKKFKNLSYVQIEHLENVSGVAASKIEGFLKGCRFKPDESSIREFYEG